MQRMGVEEPPIVCMSTTIQNLHHSIRTVYDDSELTFTGQLWTVPIQGVGQGNGAGPQIGAASVPPSSISYGTKGIGPTFGQLSPSSISYDTKDTGPTFGQLSLVQLSALSATPLLTTTDLCVTNQNPHDTEADVALRMQQALDLSEGGIRATGSAIVPEKSHWYLIAIKSGSKEIGDTSRRLKLRHTSVSAIAMAM